MKHSWVRSALQWHPQDTLGLLLMKWKSVFFPVLSISFPQKSNNTHCFVNTVGKPCIISFFILFFCRKKKSYFYLFTSPSSHPPPSCHYLLPYSIWHTFHIKVFRFLFFSYSVLWKNKRMQCTPVLSNNPIVNFKGKGQRRCIHYSQSIVFTFGCFVLVGTPLLHWEVQSSASVWPNSGWRPDQRRRRQVMAETVMDPRGDCIIQDIKQLSS